MSKKQLFITVDTSGVLDALAALAVIKEELEQVGTLPKETMLTVINGYMNQMRGFFE